MTDTIEFFKIGALGKERLGSVSLVDGRLAGEGEGERVLRQIAEGEYRDPSDGTILTLDDPVKVLKALPMLFDNAYFFASDFPGGVDPAAPKPPPWAAIDEVPVDLRMLDGVPLSLEQANTLAMCAQARGGLRNPNAWEACLKLFKRLHGVVMTDLGAEWVRHGG